MESSKVAVIGIGNWGKNLVRNFANLGALAMVCDLDQNLLAAVDREYPSVRTTNNLEAVLSDPEVKAVVVATPSDSHFPVARQALRAGKHVYVEKPMARDVRHAEELDQIATENNLVLMVG
ncbi:MAG: Gfo/Idh/MocA family oxidoreductase, partial [Candidatus Obscuribacterales bacterium]|nr:Gfo/Idh/MocA family oxidoreductase [Candidatus Obscuribacterales bacterium]